MSKPKKNKNKIMTTNRIRLKGHRVIYCSCDIIREVRPMLVRANQLYVTAKGESDNLFWRLTALAHTKPDHFPTTSRLILGVD